MRRSTLVLSMAIVLIAGAAMAADPAIGVAEFKNTTHAGWWYSDVGNDLAGMLTNELAATGKFKIVERSKLGPIIDEQNLSEAGRVSDATRVKAGKLTGARYLVFATVSAFDTKSAGGGGGITIRGINLGGKKEDAYMAVDLRVVDTKTGEIEYTRTVEARSSSYGISGGVYRGGFGGNLAKFNNTPTGKAIRGVIVEIVDYLTCAMVDQNDCMDEYNAKEKSRREKTKKSIKLD